MHNVHQEPVGRPTVLSRTEEEVIVKRLLLMADWGFPLSPKDLKIILKDYLDAKGAKARFKDNLPGKDLLSGFQRRHPEISKRRANLLKRSRARVGPTEVKEFFKHFTKVAEGVPPKYIQF